MKIEIKNRWSAEVIFSHETDDNSIKLTLQMAVRSGANLYGADLCGAKVEEGSELIGDRPFFQIGPIGSRMDFILSFITNNGLRIRAGCFFGTKEQFIDKLEESHGDNILHSKEYKAAIAMIEVHAELWAPK